MMLKIVIAIQATTYLPVAWMLWSAGNSRLAAAQALLLLITLLVYY